MPWQEVWIGWDYVDKHEVDIDKKTDGLYNLNQYGLIILSVQHGESLNLP